MAQPKPLFIPWLKARIDSGLFPGVDWTDPGRTEFSVPWKHALRQDSSSTDILIFKAWAEVSGNGQAQGDPSVWKRNFRSTLRAKKFVMVRRQARQPQPQSACLKPSEISDGIMESAECESSPPVESQEEEELSTPVQEENQQDPFIFLDQNVETILLQEDNIYLATTTINDDDLQDCLMALNIQPSDTAAMPEELPQPVEDLACASWRAPQLSPMATGGEAAAEGHPTTEGVPVGAGGAGQQQPVAEQFLQSLSQTWVDDAFKTQFKVSVFYRGVQVSENLVDNEAGFRLVYSPEMRRGEVDHQSGLTLVTLPTPPVTFDSVQNRLTQQVLDSLGAGVDVGVSGSVVYSHRRGNARAFWSRCKFDRSREPQQVAKMEPQALFRFQDFVGGIQEFIAGGKCPSCCLYICLGEEWPGRRPWEKKLVMVEVVFTSLEFLRMMAEDGGASSLQSVELQMSLTEMMEVE
ncbi:interferon regulatory factor 3 isoform X2 [Gadus chalcogrammus]|uniref:interferon regulatory factor 3 isoform X2 n=1 Tax=Gadus chalcogrammus TaxID=1042646 RepID=UPI0024C4BAD6|nr:interferon regulatory factor 3 isoform X2 [Gadus chalcogrammus]